MLKSGLKYERFSRFVTKQEHSKFHSISQESCNHALAGSCNSRASTRHSRRSGHREKNLRRSTVIGRSYIQFHPHPEPIFSSSSRSLCSQEVNVRQIELLPSSSFEPCPDISAMMTVKRESIVKSASRLDLAKAECQVRTATG